MIPKHPLSTVPNYLELIKKYVSIGSVRSNTVEDLTQFSYNDLFAWQNGWNCILEISRGIIFDKGGNLIALPFPKFYSFGQHDCTIEKLPNLPYKTYTKWDGSLIICYWYNNRWCFATKGSLKSEQAKAAEKLFYENRCENSLMDIRRTYLFEYVAPTNQIVVKYPEPKLILIGCYSLDNFSELDPEEEYNFSGFDTHGVVQPIGVHNVSVNEALSISKSSTSGSMEGFVLRFDNGYRIKIKTEHYVHLHRIVSNLTPKRILEALIDQSRRNLESRGILEQIKSNSAVLLGSKTKDESTSINLLDAFLPEEHTSYINNIQNLINDQVDNEFRKNLEIYDIIVSQLGSEFTQKQFAIEVMKMQKNLSINNSQYQFMIHKGINKEIVRYKILSNMQIDSILVNNTIPVFTDK